MDTDVEAQHTMRLVITKEQYEDAVRAAREALGPAAADLGTAGVGELVADVLTAAGVLTPPPEPDPDTCGALFPDDAGQWQQCQDEPGHDPADGHDSGEWSWPADAHEAIPPAAGA